MKLRVSSCCSFFLSNSTADTYFFTAPNCTTTIISLELCALNAEFQHFIVRLNKNIFYFADTTERGDRGGDMKPKDRVKTELLYA
jgi:predicted naringenin-chalcone synthase